MIYSSAINISRFPDALGIFQNAHVCAGPTPDLLTLNPRERGRGVSGPGGRHLCWGLESCAVALGRASLYLNPVLSPHEGVAAA